MSNKRAGRENRAHIGIFGRCNSGKSTLLNFIVGAETAIVAPQPGTTTDVVRKSFELLDFAPVVFIDTAGIDDTSEVGRKRVERSMETIWQVDLALLVFREWGEFEEHLQSEFRKVSLPYLLVRNKFEGIPFEDSVAFDEFTIELDALRGSKSDHDRLIDAIKVALPKESYTQPALFGDKLVENDVVVLVCPIDEAAPKGRLILPQVQAIRELLDRWCVSMVVQPSQLETIFNLGIVPKLVVTDSQAFKEVASILPKGVELTSFSIVLAAAKGDYDLYQKGLESVDLLKDGDKILIAENCSHQISCEDIGRVKIPRWLENYTNAKLQYTVVSGLSPLPEDLSDYSLMIQCGGCMVTRSQLRNRIRQASSVGVPVTNYGMLIRKLKLEGSMTKRGINCDFCPKE